MTIQRSFNHIIVLLVLLTLLGCKFEGGILGLDESSSTTTSNDFLKSEILIVANGLADGVSLMTVTVRLRNSDNSLVSGFTPTFSASMTGMVGLGCGISNAEGISVCQFRSTHPGSTMFVVTNLGFTLEKLMTFDTSVQGSYIESVAGTEIKQTGTGGWTASGSVMSPSVSHLSGDGYKVLIGPQGLSSSP